MDGDDEPAPATVDVRLSKRALRQVRKAHGVRVSVSGVAMPLRVRA